MLPSTESPATTKSPNPDDLARLVEGPQMRSWSLTVLLVLSVLAALYVARDVVVPLLLAFVLSLVFAPVVRALRVLKLPDSLGALVVVSALVAAAATGIYQLGEPAAEWLQKAPKSVRVISGKLSQFSQPVQTVTRASEEVERMSQAVAGTSPPAGKQAAREVRIQSPTFASVIFSAVQDFAVATVSMLILLYYFLASGDLLLRKVIAVTPNLADKESATEISRQVESEISSYLFTVTLINTLLGASVALALYALGVPNPVLWGLMVGCFNFVPYLGDIASLFVLTAVGLLSFDDLGRAALVPGAFVLLTGIEGYFVTPLLLANRLSLNPVVIVLSVLFWGWMWGVSGALLAVPILVGLKTVSARVTPLKAFGEFLGA